jgi:2-polyprenyl-3-methyl-5-hydroxy-6-metoxy-1,4-benzoquinol methylase
MSNQLHSFYCTEETNQKGTVGTRYEIWEKGEPLGDSITPSTYCAEYRSHLGDKIVSLIGTDASIYSIGCGNAFIEGELVKKGIKVDGIDFNEEAAELASKKGVNATSGDYYDLENDLFKSYDLIYADGLIGHLFKEDNGLERFFEKMKDLNLKKGCRILLSNDAPLKNEAVFTKNESVKGFWLLSIEYLRDILERYGYEVEEDYYFSYERPISGTRNRSICVAKVS